MGPEEGDKTQERMNGEPREKEVPKRVLLMWRLLLFAILALLSLLMIQIFYRFWCVSMIPTIERHDGRYSGNPCEYARDVGSRTSLV